jgi:polar amino acid transport system substrate-binding protein
MPICVLTVLRYPEAGFVTPDTPFTIEPIGMAVSASDPQLHSLLDNYVEALEKAGVLDLLTRTWIKDAGWIKELP